MTTCGAAAWATVADGLPGNYLVASSRSAGEPSCILDASGTGSLVAVFNMPAVFSSGGCVGRSSNYNLYGDSYWVNWIGQTNMICYQVDIGGKTGATAAAPASLGRIKATFR